MSSRSSDPLNSASARNGNSSGGANGHSPRAAHSDSEKLDRIRELLYGDTNRAQIERISALEASLVEGFERLKAEHAKEMQSLRYQLEGKIKALHARLDSQEVTKVDRGSIGDALAEIASKIRGDQPGK